MYRYSATDVGDGVLYKGGTSVSGIEDEGPSSPCDEVRRRVRLHLSRPVMMVYMTVQAQAGG